MMIAVAGLVGGCSMSSPIQSTTYRQSIGENTTPMVIDGAMQLRDWNRSTAIYSSGGVPAGHIGFLFEEHWNEAEWTYAALETPLFIGQTLAFPVVFALGPPWQTVIYHGDSVGPSYTAMPPLPASN